MPSFVLGFLVNGTLVECEEERRLNSRAPERLVLTANRVRKHPRSVLPFLRRRRWRRLRGNNFEIGMISNSSLKNAKLRHRSHRWNPGKSPGKVGESRERPWRHQPAKAKVLCLKEGARHIVKMLTFVSISRIENMTPPPAPRPRTASKEQF